MKYIVEYTTTFNQFLTLPSMYMVEHRHWTPIFRKAKIHNSRQNAIDIVLTQYPATNEAWNCITIHEYTDQEYFNQALKK